MSVQLYVIYREGRMYGLAVGIVCDEFPEFVAFKHERDIRAGDELVLLSSVIAEFEDEG